MSGSVLHKNHNPPYSNYRVIALWFLSPRHSKNGGGALSVTPVLVFIRVFVRAFVRPSVCYQNLVSAQ